MFSSLASFLFGSSTSETKNCDPNKHFELEEEQKGYLICENQLNICSEKDISIIKANEEPEVITTRNKNKGSNKKNKSKQQLSIEVKQPFSKLLKPQEQQPLNAEASPNFAPETSSDEDFDLDENDWCFVEKEEAIASNSFSGRNSISRDKNRTSAPLSELVDGQISKQATLRQNFGHTPHENPQNNFKKRNCNTSECDVNTGSRGTEIFDDEAITQSLYAASVCQDTGHNTSGASNDSNGSGTMVGSWYLTPPPCFTSNGPIHMEISPFENLLIEHPSMSVYHSIRSAQKATESFVNVDLETKESNHQQEQPDFENISHYCQEEKENSRPSASPKLKVSPLQPPAVEIGQNAQVVVEERATGPRIDRRTAAQLKMELFAWNSQKCMAIQDRRNLRRNAILRTNQVREIDGRANRQRRADLQHCRLISGANNNRKCC